MSEQALDLRRSMRIVRRHKILVGTAAVLGLAAGVAFSILRPPALASSALVVLPPSASRYISTQVVVADSDPVLAKAIHQLDQPTSLQALQSRVQVKSLSPTIISISAYGKTAAQAEDTANAIATSYVDYIGSAKNPSLRMQAHVLQRAVSATGSSPHKRMVVYGIFGILLGTLIGAIIVLAIFRNPRRLRERDGIADSIGVPVLASVSVTHPSDAGQWSRLLDEYKPGIVHAWQLRTALSYLEQAHAASANGSRNSANGRDDNSLSITVLSLSSDRGALALGPQLAVYAASLGIATLLVIGPQQDMYATAALRAACTAPPSPKRSSRLLAAAADADDFARLPAGQLTVVVAVVDPQAPQVPGTLSTSITVLGVSAGAVTAEQLAGVAASAAADGRQISGILVANPDPADQTTGRLPQLTRPAQPKMPTRITGMPTEARQQTKMTGQ